MSEMKNPFSVMSPEGLSTEEVLRLFVEVAPEFNLVKEPRHSMVMGFRGTGKSMMFRYMLPDVQMAKNNITFHELPYLAVHVPIKNAQLQLTELTCLDSVHSSALINEHFLVLHVWIVVLKALREYARFLDMSKLDQVKSFVDECYADGLLSCGCRSVPEIIFDGSDVFTQMHKYALSLFADFLGFVSQSSPLMPMLPGSAIRYNLPLLSYKLFLVPFLRRLRTLPGFPDCDFHLLVDDADNLSESQTLVLNTWLSCRTSPDVNVKVAAQLGKYKTFYNVNGLFVESPHDFCEINICERFSKDFPKYRERIREIVERRLKDAGQNCGVEKYFPNCEEQERAISKITDDIKSTGQCDGQACRNNDAPRMARAVYIRQLGEKQNVRSSYRYAGFEQLVWLSSGIVRYFLDAAATMFDRVAKSATPEGEVGQIPFAIQDAVIRMRAEDRMFLQFAKMSVGAPKERICLVEQLQNLTLSIGDTFHERLVSKKSERKLFSIALTNTPTRDVLDVLNFGVEHGYFHYATIGNKSGTGKTWLYPLNKSLAPHFGLDPIGDAGYLFVTNDALRDAIASRRLLREATPTGCGEQMELFD